MSRYRDRNIKPLLIALLALTTAIGLVLTGCLPQSTTTPTKSAASPEASAQTPPQADSTAVTALRSTSLLILHTNDVAGYIDPCG